MTFCHTVTPMILIGINELHDFFKKHVQSKSALIAWAKLVSEGYYTSFNQLRKTFPSADYVYHIYTIFNISGNKYRLVTMINYDAQVVMIKRIWTHAEYDMSKNKNILKRGGL